MDHKNNHIYAMYPNPKIQNPGFQRPAIRIEGSTKNGNNVTDDIIKYVRTNSPQAQSRGRVDKLAQRRLAEERGVIAQEVEQQAVIRPFVLMISGDIWLS